MQIKCLCCGSVASLDLLIAAEDGASEVIQMAGEMPPELWRAIVPYIALFRPNTTKLTWSRMGKLMGELHPLIKAAQFERNRTIVPAPLNYWLTAMEQVVAQRDRLTLPLKTHGYLLEIIVGIDAKAAKQADKKDIDPVNKSPPPEKQQPAKQEEPPADLMSKEEARQGWKSLLALTQQKATPRTNTEDPETARQKAIDELERQAELKAKEN